MQESDTLKLIWRGQYYPDTKAIQGQHKSHRPTNISVEHQWKILNKILEN